MTRPFDPERDWPCWCACKFRWCSLRMLDGHDMPVDFDWFNNSGNARRINVPHAVAEAWFRRGVEEGWLKP